MIKSRMTFPIEATVSSYTGLSSVPRISHVFSHLRPSHMPNHLSAGFSPPSLPKSSFRSWLIQGRPPPSSERPFLTSLFIALTIIYSDTPFIYR